MPYNSAESYLMPICVRLLSQPIERLFDNTYDGINVKLLDSFDDEDDQKL